jgi:hypothetical protein
LEEKKYMVVKLLLKNAPVIGSVYGLTQTAIKVHNCTTPTGAVITAGKSIILDCTSPIVKYPALCAAFLACGVASFTTGGNPLAVSAMVTVGECIIEQV